MSEWKAIAADPVKFAKKKPLIAAGVVGIALLLVILLKPKNTEIAADESYSDTENEFVPDYAVSGFSDGSYSDYPSAPTDTTGGVTTDDLTNALDAMAYWVTDSLGTTTDTIYEQMEQERQVIDLMENEPEEPSTTAAEILAKIALNAAQARNLYSGSWDTDEINDLHGENIVLAESIGGVYDPATGRYHYTSGSSGYSAIEQQMAENSRKANAIFATVNNWSDPSIQKLHDENLRLAAQIGKTYDPSTGQYSQPVTVQQQQQQITNTNTAPKTYTISTRSDGTVTNKNDVTPATTQKDSNGNVTGLTASNGVSSKVVSESGGKKVTVNEKEGTSTVGNTTYIPDGKGGWITVG